MTTEPTVLITGASSGIGRAIAMALAPTAGSLYLVGRDRERLEDVARLARTAARSVFTCRVDLASDAERSDFVRSTEGEFNGLDVLIHCAGIHSIGKFENSPVPELDAMYAVNVRAPYALTQALLPRLRARQGQVVLINSSQSLRARANTGAYAVTHHARKALADSLRNEVNPAGIRVLSIFVGRTATPLMQAVYGIEGRPYQPEVLLQPEDIALVVKNALMMPRTAEITNIEPRPLIKSY